MIRYQGVPVDLGLLAKPPDNRPPAGPKQPTPPKRPETPKPIPDGKPVKALIIAFRDDGMPHMGDVLISRRPMLGHDVAVVP